MLICRKKWKLLIFLNFCSMWPETNCDDEDMWVSKVKVISWPWPKVIYIWKLKLAFLRNDWAHFEPNFILCLVQIIRWAFHRTIGPLVSLMMKRCRKNPISFSLGRVSVGITISTNLFPVLKFVSWPWGVLALAYFRLLSISTLMDLNSSSIASLLKDKGTFLT